MVFIEDVGRLRAQAQQMKLVALGRLTASIAHEIRNPLSSINHAAELLAETEHAQAGDDRLVTIIRDNVHRLDRIVEEVLYLNRRDRAEPEKIEARPFLEQFAADFCANEKVPPDGVQIEVRTTLAHDFRPAAPAPGPLEPAAQRLAPRAQAARVRARDRSGTRTSRDGSRLEVADDGPGVAPELQPHLFEPFFTTEAQGTGLGLYIARELCEGNGARIEYRDDGPGCRFRVTLRGT